MVFWYLNNIQLRPSLCVAILKMFHNQQFLFQSDEYNILLAVFPRLLKMMNHFSNIPKQWFPDTSRGKPSFRQFENAGGFGQFGLAPQTFEEFLYALCISDLEILDCTPFNGMCRFVKWSIELQKRSTCFRLEHFHNDSYLSSFLLPVTNLEYKLSILDKKSHQKF